MPAIAKRRDSTIGPKGPLYNKLSSGVLAQDSREYWKCWANPTLSTKKGGNGVETDIHERKNEGEGAFRNQVASAALESSGGGEED